MLDSSSCMLVRSEETQPLRADDALESMFVDSSFVWVYSSTSIGIAFGAYNSFNSKHSKSPGCSSAKIVRVPPTVCEQASDGDDERRTARLPPDYPSHLNPIHQYHHITHNVSPRQEVPRQSW